MIIALAGATAISFAPLLYIRSDTTALTGAFFRMFYALPILGILVFVSKREDARDKNSRWLAFGAGILLAIDFAGYHTAIDYIGSGIATMIGNSQVIIVTLASWWLFGERPNRFILLSLPMVMLGLLLISGIGGMVAAVFYSYFLIAYRQSNRIAAPAVNAQFDATAGAALGILILGTIPPTSLGLQAIDHSITWPSHGWLLFLAIFCQVIGWIAITYALPRLPAAHTSFAVLLQPVLTIIWGVIILNESPSLQQSAGMVLIFAAIIAVTLFGATEESTPSIENLEP